MKQEISNRMKFQYLKIGQQFSYQGETYVKTTPLVACHAESGQQKLIPRYAEIRVFESGPAPAPQPSPQSLSGTQVRAAVDQFHELCLTAIQDIVPQDDAVALQTFQSRLNAARKQILQQLKLAD
jgi:hypothetical protein